MCYELHACWMHEGHHEGNDIARSSGWVNKAYNDDNETFLHSQRVIVSHWIGLKAEGYCIVLCVSMICVVPSDDKMSYWELYTAKYDVSLCLHERRLIKHVWGSKLKKGVLWSFSSTPSPCSFCSSWLPCTNSRPHPSLLITITWRDLNSPFRSPSSKPIHAWRRGRSMT